MYTCVYIYIYSKGFPYIVWAAGSGPVDADAVGRELHDLSCLYYYY